MPILNFQRRFADAVEYGQKKQTIRATRKYPIKVGDKLYLYTGLRTKAARKLGEAICTGVRTFEIMDNGLSFIVNGINLYYEDYMNRFAHADGFDNWQEMVRWFSKVHGLPFKGDIIQWKMFARQPHEKEKTQA